MAKRRPKLGCSNADQMDRAVFLLYSVHNAGIKTRARIQIPVRLQQSQHLRLSLKLAKLVRAILAQFRGAYETLAESAGRNPSDIPQGCP